MLRKIKPHLPEEFVKRYEEDIEKMDRLSVGLRYRFDTWDFRGNKEDLYCETIGSDLWLSNMQSALDDLIDCCQQKP